ncbi:MAG: hypothetical protein K2P52_08495 [Campylobacterales bacterium]|nr:hypothetical protein [Campylobacterales bacterium]
MGGEVPIELRPQYNTYIKNTFVDPYKGVDLSKLGKQRNILGEFFTYPTIFLDRLIRTIKDVKRTKKTLSIEDYKIIFSEVKSLFPEITFKVTNKFINSFLNELRRTAHIKQAEDAWYDKSIAYAAGNLGDEIHQTIIINGKEVDASTIPSVPLPKPLPYEPDDEIPIYKPKPKPKPLPYEPDDEIPIYEPEPKPNPNEQKDIDRIIKEEIARNNELLAKRKEKNKAKKAKKKGEDMRSALWFNDLGKEDLRYRKDVKTANENKKLFNDWNDERKERNREIEEGKEYQRRLYQENKEEGVIPEEDQRLSDYFREWWAPKKEILSKPFNIVEGLEFNKKGIIEQIKDKYKEYRDDAETANEEDYDDNDYAPKKRYVSNVQYMSDLITNANKNIPKSKYQPGVGVFSDDEYSFNDDVPEEDSYIPIYQSESKKEIPLKKEIGMFDFPITKELIKEGIKNAFSYPFTKSQKEQDNRDFENYVDSEFEEIAANHRAVKKEKELKFKNQENQKILFEELFAEIDPDIVEDEIQREMPNIPQGEIDKYKIKVMDDLYHEEQERISREFAKQRPVGRPRKIDTTSTTSTTSTVGKKKKGRKSNQEKINELSDLQGEFKMKNFKKEEEKELIRELASELRKEEELQRQKREADYLKAQENKRKYNKK